MTDGNLRGDEEEALGKINGTSSKGGASEKGEPNTVRSVQHWIYNQKLIQRFNRDKDTPFQPVHHN